MLKALLLLPFFATCRGYIPHKHILAKQHKFNIVTTSSSLYYSSLGGRRGTTNRFIFHDNSSCSTNPPRIGPHHADLLRIRGGSGVGGSTLNSSSSTQLALVLNPSLASLLSGSIAGAIGVGVAFPLDTLKTKSQVLGKARGTGGDGVEGGGTNNAEYDIAGTAAAVGSASVALSASATTDAVDASKLTMMQLINLIYRTEGIAGFFGGVKGMMVGQGE